MDPISYGVAAKQKQRIEKVIAEPDSTSGVITVPKVIATGETITVPAGRTAVLPNVQVDGELVVDGEVFIPSGSSYTATSINVAGTGSRITGDFSNATLASRTAVQTNVANKSTQLTILPNGTSDVAGVLVYNTSNPTNSQWGQLIATSTAVTITAGSSGTLSGTYIPMTFNTGGEERMRIDTSGNVLVTGSGGLGYGTGSGGTVTQLTSKSTAVTLNKPSGQIIMNNSALSANTAANFNFSNSLLTSSSDTLLINISSGGTQGSYAAYVAYVVNGVCVISVKNISTISLSEALVLNFTVIKGAVA